jgi:hypothetical protein
MPNAERGQKANEPTAQPRQGWWVRLIHRIKHLLQERKSRREKESSADKAVRVTATATVWMAFFTFVLAFVGIVTLIEIIRGGTDTHDLALAAENQSVTMKNQLEAMRIDERAWLGVVHKGKPVLVANAAPSMLLVVTDTGKTPAIHVSGNYYVEVIENGQNPHFEAQVAHLKTIDGVILPNGFIEIPVQRWRHTPGAAPDIGEPDPLTKEEKEALEDGNAWMAVHGLIYYGDVFQKRHWVRFCYWYHFTLGRFDALECNKYNGIDEEPN